jgi:hypothetical protein
VIADAPGAGLGHRAAAERLEVLVHLPGRRRTGDADVDFGLRSLRQQVAVKLTVPGRTSRSFDSCGKMSCLAPR